MNEYARNALRTEIETIEADTITVRYIGTYRGEKCYTFHPYRNGGSVAGGAPSCSLELFKAVTDKPVVIVKEPK